MYFPVDNKPYKLFMSTDPLPQTVELNSGSMKLTFVLVHSRIPIMTLSDLTSSVPPPPLSHKVLVLNVQRVRYECRPLGHV